VSSLSPQEIQQLDRVCRDVFGIPTLLLMEHASLAIAAAAEDLLAARKGPILALCGAGHNGGDAAAAARQLFNRGHGVEVVFVGSARSPDPSADHEINFEIVRRLGIDTTQSTDPSWIAGQARAAGLILDGLVGTGLSGPLRPPLGEVIRALAEAAPRSLAIDIPSGLSGLTGEPMPVALAAEVTVTLGFSKSGFDNPTARPYLGRVMVADIGYPRPLRERPRDYLSR
jgi:NAD(P)H-hydrate epimerase